MTLDPDPPAAQRAEILRAIEADTAAYLGKDLTRWSECFVNDDRMTSMIVTADMGLLRSKGFAQFKAAISRAMAATPVASNANVGRQDMQITVSGDMAWASFNQTIEKSANPMDPPSLSHEFRLLERHDGKWRIAFHAMFEPRLSAETVPLIEVDENCQVLRMNDMAREKMKQFKSLTISAGRLRASRPVWDKTLQATVANASALLNYPEYNRMFRESGRKATFPVVLGEGDGRLVVCLVLVTDFKLFVSFDDPEGLAQRLSIAGVIYGLTEAQQRLAGHIAEGSDLPSAAEAMGISVNTAKTHLKRMFDKTGIHAQTALIRLLLSVG